MRAHVFTDRALRKHARRFVWLAIDTEKETNAPFVEKFPITTWPTLMIIDPATEAVALRWAGSANPRQFEKLLKDGDNALKQKEGSQPDALLAKADRLNGRRAPEAVAAYREAVQKSDWRWPRRARALESFVVALSRNDHEECATTALKELPKMPPGPSSANVAVLALGCATGAPAEAPWRKAAVDGLYKATLVEVKRPGLLADDRSGLYESLVDVAKGQEGEPAAKKLAAEWLQFLEAEAAKAKTAEARAAFDPHRVGAAIALGDPARALAALEQSEKDFPADYNPPFRIAIVYRELGRFDEALAASDRALSRVYGPRKIRALEIRAGIHEKKGDKPAARKTMQEALATARALPPGQRSDKTIARLQAAIDKMK